MRSASVTTLPVIVEDDITNHPPPYTEQDSGWTRERQSEATDTESAPALVEKPERKPPGYVREQIDKRGGWKRFYLIVAIILIFLIAVGVGSGIGLAKQRKKKEAESDDEIKTDPSFPIGLWRFNTVLLDVNTDCTSNSDTFRCYPFSTFSESPSNSNATFDWIISASEDDENEYQIRSTNNPFSYSFGNTTLTYFRDVDEEGDHYSFSTMVDMTVTPVVPLNTTEGVAVNAVCNYQAELTASLYTWRRQLLPGNDAVPDQNPRLWPFASDIVLRVASGKNVPECVGARNGDALAGDFWKPAGSWCSCWYTNTVTQEEPEDW